MQPNVRNSLVTTVEIESEEEGDVQSYFRIWRKDGDTMRNFMQESMGVSNINITVDNSDSFSPTLGATFVINPKVRNNSEGNPARILNAQNNNAEVESSWEGFDFVNDGWMTTGVSQLFFGVYGSQGGVFARLCHVGAELQALENTVSERNLSDGFCGDVQDVQVAHCEARTVLGDDALAPCEESRLSPTLEVGYH